MLEIYQRLDTQTPPTIDTRVALDHLQRDKGRLRVQSSEGQEVRIFLERGKPLQVGEVLRSACGRHVLVEGAKEAVTTARCDDWQAFSRACYHLGNRHVRLQLGERWLRIKPDHVLEEMLVQLGLDLIREEDVFAPEPGAYSHGHHHH